MSMAKSSVIGVRREENGGIVSGISRIGSLGGPGPTSPVVVILMFAVAVHVLVVCNVHCICTCSNACLHNL